MANINGTPGNDTLTGGNGADTIDGGVGNDLLLGGAGNDTLTGGADNDQMFGGAGNDRMVWNPGDASDVMDGGSGIDAAEVNGGAGAEAFIVAADGAGVRLDRTSAATFGIDIRTTERLVLNAGGGDDVLTTTGNLAARIALSVDGGAGNDTLSGGNGKDVLLGGADDDVLDGGAGNDTLDGGTGSDNLTGGIGNDTYIVTDGTDTITENAGQGIDVVMSTVTHQLAANVENLTLVGAADLTGVGNELANVINGSTGNDRLFGETGNDSLIGGAGNDVLLGGAGNDRMIGGKGNETYLVDNTRDVVTEFANEGNDTVFSASATYTLAANIENLLFDATIGAAIGTGNVLANIIVGGSGDDKLDGQAGNDMLDGQAGNDTLIGGTGNDTLTGGTGTDQMLGGAGNDRMIWNPGDGSDVMEGGSGIDTAVVNGGGVAEAFTVAADGAGVRFDRTGAAPFGIDIRTTEQLVLNAGAGNDVFTATGNLAPLIQLTIDGGAGNDTISGGNGKDILLGGADDDVLDGGAGNDTLDGGFGADKMAGGAGNDTYVVTDDLDTITENAKEGIDRVISTVDHTLTANVENLTLAGAATNGIGNELANVITGNDVANLLDGLNGNDTLSGNGGDDDLLGFDGNDTLNGGAGNDELDGEAGDDRMAGGTGDDFYIVDSIGDKITENANQGLDIVFSSISHTLGANVEDLVLDSGDINGTGNTLNNLILGGAGKNRLDGGGGNDTIDGGGGDDQMLGGAGNDTMIWNPGGANDLMDGGSGIDTALVNGGGGAETFTVAADGKGVRFDRINPGPFGIDIRATEKLEVNAGAGDDVFTATGNLAGRIALKIDGGSGNDTISGGNGNDLLNGGADDDVLNGDAGNDTLDGGAGADKMAGGAGNDAYFVQDPADTITENANEGIDRVISDVDQRLAANVENLTLTGAAISGTGNELNNVIDGNDVVNSLRGLDGNDTLNGNGGNDALDGGNGDDLLNGGADDDLLIGNGGNDLLNGNEGNDLLVGNEGNDILNGGDGNDRLNGDDGNDKMAGGKGDDIYNVDSAKDVVIESANQGHDGVASSVSFALGSSLEDLLLDGGDIDGTGNTLNNVIIGSAGKNKMDGGAGHDTLMGRDGNDFLQGGDGNDTLDGGAGDDQMLGGAGNDELEGNAGNDTLIGGAGNDTLIGGQGADVMDSGAGRDIFRYEIFNPLDLENLGGDIINGFQHGQDRIDLSDLLSDLGIDADDAFSGGFLKIEVVGNNTNILFDFNGGGDGFATLATLNNVKNVTADDLITTPL